MSNLASHDSSASEPSRSEAVTTTADIDLEFLIAVVRRAGDRVLSMQAGGLQQVGSKSSTVDLVTEADVAAEKLIRSELYERYPDVGFWGEESNEAPDLPSFWVVDPIDGTTNFANGVPYFAVNLAYYQDGATRLGVTLELPSRVIYFARLGGGAYRRPPDGADTPMRTNQAETLQTALLTTGFPYHRSEYEDNNLAEFNYFLAHAQGVRVMGAAALDFANVAMGAVGGYWEGWLQPWDAAAGVLLVEEAGGKVTDYRGRPWALTTPALIASNGLPELHAALEAGVHTARSRLQERLLPD